MMLALPNPFLSVSSRPDILPSVNSAGVAEIRLLQSRQRPSFCNSRRFVLDVEAFEAAITQVPLFLMRRA